MGKQVLEKRLGGNGQDKGYSSAPKGDVKLERKVYSFDEAIKASTEYFNGDDLAATTWINKYALKDSFGKLYESNPDQMHNRLASEIARIEQQYPNPMSKDEIYGLLKDFKYIVPQGGPMTGIGNDYQKASLSNCFVIGEGADSYGGILKVDQEQVQLMKRRGGVGHDLSHIRPRSSPVENSALTSTGVVPFMERYSNSTREVAQDGRRGALMLSISSKHPDSEAFIDAKMTPGKITGANVSVRIDDDFMEAVKNDKEYIQQYPIDSENPTHEKDVNAKKIWEKIIHNAWKSAEPGVLFWDTIERESIPDVYSDFGYKTVSTNPCGEIPLCPYDSCRLLAINLYSHVDKPFTKEANFNYGKFEENVSIAQRIMDDIIDLELEKIDGILNKIGNDPEDEEVKRPEKKLWQNIRHKAEEGRRTGVGVTGEGDMLAALNYRYGSDEGNDFSEDLHKKLALGAYRSSVDMARERGAFGIYDAKLEEGNPFIQRIKNEDPNLYSEMVKHGRRNIALLTIAPTGTTSIMTQTTSGIEPVFLPVYKRNRKIDSNVKDKGKVKVAYVDEVGDEWEEFKVFHHKFETWLDVNGYDVSEVKNMDDKELQEIVDKSPYYQATSNDVDWVKKVELQGKVQKWVDHSISVTVNLPKDISEEKVGEVYMKGWEVGCKGITVYRDGSRGKGVMNSGKDEKGELFPKKRPKSLDAEVLKFNNNDEKWISFVGLYEGKPYEIFTGKIDEEVLAVPTSISKGKIVKEKNGDGAHYDFHFKTKRGHTSVVGGISDQFKKEYWNYARLISGMLRNGVPVEDVVDSIDKLEDVEGINSWKNGSKRALKKYIEDGTEIDKICKDCNQNFVYKEGCEACGCGSKCD